MGRQGFAMQRLFGWQGEIGRTDQKLQVGCRYIIPPFEQSSPGRKQADLDTGNLNSRSGEEVKPPGFGLGRNSQEAIFRVHVLSDRVEEVALGHLSFYSLGPVED